MTQQKYLSVVMPVYNVAPFLNRCINSVLNQTYRNLEIICINDGSTDNSLEILNQYAAKDPRVFVISQKNSGVSGARNTGIQRSTGEYITFVDSDDAIEKDMYETLIRIIEREEADIAHCGYRRIAPDGTIKDVSGTGEYLVQDSESALKCLLNGEKYVGSLCNKVYKKTLFKEIRLDQEIKYNEDILANIQLFSAAKKTVFIDEPKYHYYVRAGSATSAGTLLCKSIDCAKAAEKVWQMLKDTSNRGRAANNLYYSLIGEYRAWLYADSPDADYRIWEICEKVNLIRPACSQLSNKQKLNFFLMRYFPFSYRLLYKIYDHIRKPNWDVV